MGNPGAFLNIGRSGHGVRPPVETAHDFDDFTVPLPREAQCGQASRCMNCGVAFCQTGAPLGGSRTAVGCPLRNLIPETNDLVFRRRWDDAAGRLGLTNPFPEFTGRVCPSPCETACNLGLNDEPVTIHDNERAISDYAWARGIDPLPTPDPTAPLASIIGSGPAGLAAAWELARRGMRVRVYERDDRPGGLLMYGIPNMKLPKWVVERRIDLMQASGIQFELGVDAAGIAGQIAGQSDVVIVACGAREPRRMDVPGADADGVFYALEYLTAATRALLDADDDQPALSAQGLDVVVIGGGDTGTDCVATALRQGARSIRQVIRAKRPPARQDMPDEAWHAAWPRPRGSFSQGYGQREAAAVLGTDPCLWSTDTVSFVQEDGRVTGVEVQDLSYEDGRRRVEGTRRVIPAQLVLIAKGFTGPEQATLDAFAGFENVHVAGDARLGASLVASAMADALDVAAHL